MENCSSKGSTFQRELMIRVLSVYNESHSLRKDAQLTVDTVTTLCEHMLRDLKTTLQANSEERNANSAACELIDEYTEILNICKTEHRRFKWLQRNDFYVPPTKHIVGEQRSIENGIFKFCQLSCEVIDIKFNLKKFLELPGVFNKIITYMHKLEQNDTVLQNIVQGQLWKTKKASHGGEIIMPFKLYFDDVEVGNNLGSHAGIHKVGTVYHQIACLPPEYQSSLQNIFLAQLFHASDWKNSSTKVIFSKLLTQLKDIGQNGIQINIDGSKYTVYFLCAVIVGDNLALNQMLGIAQSFSANHYCRFCKMSRDVAKSCTMENRTLLRNRENYESDLQVNTLNITGIKEECVFHELPFFHMSENHYVDIAHDIFEGICFYEIAEVLHQLVFKEKFIQNNSQRTLDFLNARIESFNYPSHQNKPPLFKLEEVRAKHFRMSAAEMKSFFMFLNVIIGDHIPAENEFWQLYLKLREIVSLLLCPQFDMERCEYLTNLIHEHHEMYIKLIGNYQPKFHFMVHYPEIIKQVGPLVHLSTLRFESKHHEMKLGSHPLATSVNITKTLAIKNQLKFAYKLLTQRGLNIEIVTGLAKDIDSTVRRFLVQNHSSCNYQETAFIKVQSIRLSCNNIVIISNDQEFPVFGKIQNILIDKSNHIIFICVLLETLYYDHHLAAYHVLPKLDKVIVPLKDINYYKSLGSTTSDSGRLLVTTMCTF